jgi:hypothetical protein
VREMIFLIEFSEIERKINLILTFITRDMFESTDS